MPETDSRDTTECPAALIRFPTITVPFQTSPAPSNMRTNVMRLEAKLVKFITTDTVVAVISLFLCANSSTDADGSVWCIVESKKDSVAAKIPSSKANAQKLRLRRTLQKQWNVHNGDSGMMAYLSGQQRASTFAL
jgi:hypothetical protein